MFSYQFVIWRVHCIPTQAMDKLNWDCKHIYQYFEINMSDSEIPGAYTFDEGRPELAPYGLTCQRWRPRHMPRPDRHNELELNLLKSGTLTYLHRGKRVTVESGRLTIFWALHPHQIIDFEGERYYYVATIPFTRFLQWRMPLAFLDRVMAGAVLSETDEDVAQHDDAMFDRWLRDVEASSPETVAAMMLEMEARLRRLTLSCEMISDETVSSEMRSDCGGKATAKSRTGGTEHSASKVEEMAVFVAAHYREPIMVSEIGEAVNLHPDYANTLFRERFGMTLSDYLLEHRIAHAQRMLATTSENVVSIAYASGFGSISRFNAAFKAASSYTPTEYRRRHHLHEDDLRGGADQPNPDHSS